MTGRRLSGYPQGGGSPVTSASRGASGRRAGRLRLVVLALLALLVAGCASGGGAVAPLKGPRGTKPYTIDGQTYHPLVSARDFREEGVASWYGKDFHGKTTANGERYDMYGMTAAHKLLPFGTKVRVTNKLNGKAITVRVNDRGPFVANRVIDLTYAGAERIGMIGSGTAPVIVETVGKVDGLRDGDLRGNFHVQVGAFADEGNARRLLARLRQEGKGGRTYYVPHIGMWRVQVGPFSSLNQAENASRALQGAYPGNFAVAE
jgi:rare lipoprotein A